eukprot:SAG11_NODE_6043_length_1402_cov_1.178818_2_plen_140_part_00
MLTVDSRTTFFPSLTHFLLGIVTLTQRPDSTVTLIHLSADSGSAAAVAAAIPVTALAAVADATCNPVAVAASPGSSDRLHGEKRKLDTPTLLSLVIGLCVAVIVVGEATERESALVNVYLLRAYFEVAVLSLKSERVSR